MRSQHLAAWAAVCLAWACPAVAAVSDSFSVDAPTPHPKAITIAESGDGAILSVKLPLEKAAKVHLARLYVTRAATQDPQDLLAEVEVFAGKAAAGKKLALVGPWFDHLDATEAVKAAVAGGGELSLFIRPLPGWQKEQTRLELWHDGKAVQPPPAVKDVKCLHRAGQTFITWKEVKPPASADKLTYGEYRKALDEAKAAVTYHIYGHDKPIAKDTILSSQLLAEVKPLSCWNANGRNIEYLIGQAMDKSDAVGELGEKTGSLMYTWGVDSERMDRYPLSRFVIDEAAGPLPAGAGLYVHTPAAAGKRYYAVVACAAGVENLTDFTSANATDKAVDETPGQGEPVCQGDGLWGPFFDYPGQRKVYVQWCGPALSPLPSMYFNWSVLVPPQRKPVLTPQEPAAAEAKPALRPAELYFHSGSFSYAKPRRKYLNDSIQLAPHDFPSSLWFGFNSSYGTLKGYGSGTVSNHTQKRIIAFLDWAKGRLGVDADRIMLPGGDGAALLALNYPDVFSYALITGFESLVAPPEKAERGKIADRSGPVAGPIWGPKSPDIKDAQGRGDWGWAMLDQIVAAAPKRDLPLFACNCESWGLHVAGFGKGKGRFFTALGQVNQPLTANWSWGPGVGLLPDKYSGLWRGLDLTRKTPLLAFANCTADANQDGNGQVNGLTRWSGLKETPETLEVVVAGRGSTDVTPRRCQLFRPRPGDRYNWQATPVPDPRARSQPASQAGQVIADANGLVTIEALDLSSSVMVKISKAE